MKDHGLLVMAFLIYLPAHAGLLHDAARFDQPHKVVRLLKLNALEQFFKGIKIDEKDAHGLSPLMHAAIKNHPKVAEALLAAGAKVDEVDAFQETALMKASAHASWETLKVLLSHKADINALNRFKVSALLMASQLDDKTSIILLLQNGADLHAKDTFGETALARALSAGKNAIVKEIIRESFRRPQKLLDSDIDLMSKHGFASAKNYTDAYNQAVSMKKRH